MKIKLCLIPKEWEKKTIISFNDNLFKNLNDFYNKICNDEGVTVFPDSEFSAIRNTYLKGIKGDFMEANAKYLMNKLIVDLGGNN